MSETAQGEVPELPILYPSEGELLDAARWLGYPSVMATGITVAGTAESWKAAASRVRESVRLELYSALEAIDAERRVGAR